MASKRDLLETETRTEAIIPRRGKDRAMPGAGTAKARYFRDDGGWEWNWERDQYSAPLSVPAGLGHLSNFSEQASETSLTD